MNPEFFAAEAREARNRLRAYFARQLPLELPRRQSRRTAVRLMQFPIVTLTWRHCLELSECGNAFFGERLAPLRGDFLEVLWRLHPYHQDSEGNFTNLRPGQRRPSWAAVVVTQIVLQVQCAQLDIQSAEDILRCRIRDAFQDEPASPAENTEQGVSLLAPTLNRFDDIAGFLGDRGWRPDEVMGAGVAYSFQMVRAWLISNGKGVYCIPPSAALVKKKQEATT